MLGGIRWSDTKCEANRTFSVEYVAIALSEPVWLDPLKQYSLSLQNMCEHADL